MFKHFVRVFSLVLLLPLLLCSTPFQLTRTTTPHPTSPLLYTLPIHLDKQQFRLRVTLNDSKSWVRGKDCVLCTDTKCHEKCSAKMGHSSGFTCKNKKVCEDVGAVKGKDEEVEGQQYLVKVDDANKTEIGQIEIVSAKNVHKQIVFTKASEKYDGELNLLSEGKGNISVFTILFPEKQPLLVFGSVQESNYTQKENQEILAIDIDSDGSVTSQSILFGSSKVDLKSMAARFTTNTKDLVLPQQIFSKLTQQISLSTGCKITASALHIMTAHCTSEQLDKIRNETLTFVLNNTKIAIPFESFISNCGKQNCTLSIRAARPSEPKEITIGEIIFINFAVTFDTEKHTVNFKRLNNVWGNKYTNKGSSWSLLSFIGIMTHFFFKVVIYATIVALLINLYFFKKKIMKWFGDVIFRRQSIKKIGKLGKPSLSYAPALSEDISEGRPRRQQFWEQGIQGI